MTIAAAVRGTDGIFVGADRMIGYGDTFTASAKNKKVFRVADSVVAYCGDVRFGNILRYNFNPTPLKDCKRLKPDQYVNQIIIDELRDCLKECGYAKHRDSREKGGDFIIVVGGRIFDVSSNYSVTEHDKYVCIGSGDTYALGSLYTYEKQFGNEFGRDACKSALDAACALSLTCGGGFDIVEAVR